MDTIEKIKEELLILQTKMEQAIDKGDVGVAYKLEDEIEQLQKRLIRLQS